METANGIGLVRSAYDHYAPTRDLVRIGLDIIDVVEADGYGAVDLEIATTLPTVWLKRAGERAVARALRAARAGATMTATLSSSVHPAADDQRLWVFMEEMSDAAGAAALEAFARDAQRGGDAVAGVAAGPLFCLIVGRSVVAGVPSFETPSRLNRFVAPIAEVLR